MEPVELFQSPAFPAKLIVSLRRPTPGGDVPPTALVGQVSAIAGRPDWATLQPSQEFVALYTSYMRGEHRAQPSILGKARVKPNAFVYVIDGRVKEATGDVPFQDIIGWYRSDASGRPVGASFVYNGKHALVAEGVFSSLLDEPSLLDIAFPRAV